MILPTAKPFMDRVFKIMRGISAVAGVCFIMGLLVIWAHHLWINRPETIRSSTAYYRSLGYGPNQSSCLAYGDKDSSACLKAFVGSPQANN